MRTGNELIGDVDRTHPTAGHLSAWWLGQHGFVLKSADAVLYVDAFLSPLPGRAVPPLLSPRDITHADLVLGSHDHADHIDRDAWPDIAAASPACTFLVPELVRDSVVAEMQISPERIVGLNAGQTIQFGHTRITGIASAHELLDRDEKTGRYPYLGFVIESGGCTVYHSGDTCVYEGLLTALRQWRFDAVFLPINGRDARRLAANCIGNMTYQEAADLAGALEPRLTVPTHFEMFPHNAEDPQLFMDYMRVKYPHLQTKVPEHGERIDLASMP